MVYIDERFLKRRTIRKTLKVLNILIVVKAETFILPDYIASKINSKILINTINPSRIFILSFKYLDTPSADNFMPNSTIKIFVSQSLKISSMSLNSY